MYILCGFILLICGLWSGLAIWYAGPRRRRWRILLIGAMVLLPSCVAGLIGYASICWLGGLSWLAVFIWWQGLKPSNDRPWLADVTQTAHGHIEKDCLTLHNVRNTQYRNLQDFTPQWETRQYDLNQLVSLDIFLSYWGSEHIAHVVMSWGFANGEHLAISIETRKATGQSYSAIKGFFKQYTLIYVAGDERDLIGLRMQHRRERVYFYRIINLPLAYKRELLKIYLDEMNELHEHPRFYHALFKNCVSGISRHFKTISPEASWIDWRLIANGHLDELLYDLKLIRRDMPFDKLRELSRIDGRGLSAETDKFSVAIRDGLILP